MWADGQVKVLVCDESVAAEILGPFVHLTKQLPIIQLEKFAVRKDWGFIGGKTKHVQEETKNACSSNTTGMD
jgi:hypothetical protein